MAEDERATEEMEGDFDEDMEGGEDLSKDKLKGADDDIAKANEELKEVDKRIEKIDDDLKRDNTTPAGRKKKEELSDVDETQALIDELKIEKPLKKEDAPAVQAEPQKAAQAPGKAEVSTHIFALRTTANREDQVMDFITSNAEKKGFKMYSAIRAHGMRGYIFVEAESRTDAEQSAFNIPYARGILPKEIHYHEIEHMLEQVKKDVNIQQNDIVEIISGPFKRENAKIIRIDKGKEEVVVELLEAAVPIPITLKLDSVKVIRRDVNEEKPDLSYE